ncbi:response regulator transcription factor [Lachnospiraceae bacterium KK002]
MKKVLVIEDETAINDLICMNLEIAGYQPVPFFDGMEFSRHLKEKDDYVLALLDIMLPGKDGFELLEELKEHDIPVIYLTAKGDLPSKVKGLRNGAEDYLVKPFEMLELLVRMDNILKRCGKSETAEEIHIRDVVINEKKRTVHKNGAEVSMQPMEFDCLLVFWKYRNRVITREQILNILWGVDFEGESRTVDVHVGNIRKKLDFSDVIITVPRVGYRMEVP